MARDELRGGGGGGGGSRGASGLSMCAPCPIRHRTTSREKAAARGDGLITKHLFRGIDSIIKQHNISPLNGRAKGGPKGPPAASCRAILLNFVAPLAAMACAFSLYYTFLLPFWACRKLADLFLYLSRILRIPLFYCCFSFSIYRSLLYSARPNYSCMSCIALLIPSVSP